LDGLWFVALVDGIGAVWSALVTETRANNLGCKVQGRKKTGVVAKDRVDPAAGRADGKVCGALLLWRDSI
jgi:hypothetical protein